MKQGGPLRDWRGLCLGWLVFVPLITAWQVMAYSGLYRWLCEWQLSTGGQYRALPTAIFPALLLMAPALAVLARQARAAPGAEAKPQAVSATFIRALAGMGALSAALGAGAWLWSQQLPDRADPPVTVDLARLGDAAPPLGSAILIGDVDFSRAVEKSAQMKGPENVQIFYLPVLAPGAAGRPVRFFVDERSVMTGRDAPVPRFPGDRLRGVLVEGGLPGDMLRLFGRHQVAIAEPYYLLMTGAESVRLNYYVTAGLAGFFATILLVSAAGLGLSARRRRVK